MWQNVMNFVSKTSNKGSPQMKTSKLIKVAHQIRKQPWEKNPNINNSRGYYYSLGKTKKTVPWNGHSWVILPSQKPEGISKDANNIIHTS